MDENAKDAEMLGLLDLSPLEVEHAGDSAPLTGKVRRHNRGLRDLAERFDRLARDRDAVTDADRWLSCDAAAVVAERHRVTAESWDVLVTLRRLLAERREVLRSLEDCVADRIDALAGRRNKALDKARKTLVREHRDYVAAEPVRARAWIEERAEEDEAVAELHRRAAVLGRILESLQSTRHKSGNETPVTVRQREVFFNGNGERF
jgi:ElaB/YqjD/DUF883 family membrane-anchored ribosome-binding protein